MFRGFGDKLTFIPRDEKHPHDLCVRGQEGPDPDRSGSPALQNDPLSQLHSLFYNRDG